jgi:Flp pilus assembly protein TadG
MRRIRSLRRDDGGATLVEATLVFPMVMILTFGLVEFGHALWEYHAVEKATAIGARHAATRGPLVAQLADGAHDCFVANPGSVPAGTACSDPAIPAGAPITCSAGSGPCSSAVRSAMLAEMRRIAPFLTDANVQIEVSPSKMGFIGRGRAIPLITVRTTGLTYDFVAIDDLLGLGALTMPGFASTLPAEDQQEGPGT